MNTINREEALSRLNALDAEAAELRKIIEAPEPSEVWAYIGTEVDAHRGRATVIGARVFDGFGLQYRYSNDGRLDWGYCRIDGKLVTHFQPIKAEVKLSGDGRWRTYFNGTPLNPFGECAREIAELILRNLAHSIAPWWKGELVITERGGAA